MKKDKMTYMEAGKEMNKGEICGIKCGDFAYKFVSVTSYDRNYWNPLTERYEKGDFLQYNDTYSCFIENLYDGNCFDWKEDVISGEEMESKKWMILNKEKQND